MGKYIKIRKYITGGDVIPSWVTAGDENAYLYNVAQGLTEDQIKEKMSKFPLSTNTGLSLAGNNLGITNGENLQAAVKQNNGFRKALEFTPNESTSTNPMGVISAVGRVGIGAAGEYFTGDKNFNAASEATDEFANAAADVASQFGPWGQAAALAITAVNTADKMAGKTVPGFKVPISSSGFGNSIKESQDSSYRLSQLGGIDKALDRRNQQAQMALQAAQLDQTNKFQLEARMASAQDVLRRNQMALAGGYGTETLGA